MNLEASFANQRKTGITIGMKNGLIAFSSLSEKTTPQFSGRFGGAEASQFCGYGSDRWAAVHYILCLSSIQGCLTSVLQRTAARESTPPEWLCRGSDPLSRLVDFINVHTLMPVIKYCRIGVIRVTRSPIRLLVGVDEIFITRKNFFQ